MRTCPTCGEQSGPTAALDALGSGPDRAQAEADLGYWLIDQGRSEGGEALLGQVRTTYAALGLDGWLARLGGIRVSEPDPTPS